MHLQFSTWILERFGEIMKVLILGKIQRGYEELKLIKEGKKIFDSVSYIPTPHISVNIDGDKFSVTYREKDLSGFDCIVPRIPRTYRTFGFSILSLLKESVYIPIEPISLFNCHNKFLTLLILDKDGVFIPKTFLTNKRKSAEDVLDEMKYPIVMKLLYGSLGKGVIFADSKHSALSMMDTLERFNQPLFIEEYIKNPNEDIRAYVVGDDVVASMKRIAKKDEKRANIGIGGSGMKFDIPHDHRNISIRAAKKLQMDICGIDLVEGPGGPVVIEANASAQFKELDKITKKNVGRKIMKYVEEKASEF